MGPLAPVDYSPTPQLIFLYLFVAIPLHYGFALLGLQIIKLLYKLYLLLMYPVFDFLFYDLPLQNNKINKSFKVGEGKKK